MAHDNLGLLKVNLYKYKFNRGLIGLASWKPTASLESSESVGRKNFTRAQADQFAKINEDLIKLWAHWLATGWFTSWAHWLVHWLTTSWPLLAGLNKLE